MQGPSELAWWLRVAACSIIVVLAPLSIMHIGALLSRRLRTQPKEPTIVNDIAIIFGIIQIIHVVVVVVATISLFVIDQLTTLDLGNSTSALGVYGTLLWQLHCVHFWPLKNKYWLVLFVAAASAVLGGLVLPAQYVENAIGKSITCAVVSVVGAWAIGIFVFLLRQSPSLRWKSFWLISMSVLSMVGCWVATALPLAFEVYLPIICFLNLPGVLAWHGYSLWVGLGQDLYSRGNGTFSDSYGSVFELRSQRNTPSCRGNRDVDSYPGI